MELLEHHPAPPCEEGPAAPAEPILIWTRFEPDSAVIARTLRQAGFRVTVCQDVESFCDDLPHCLLGILTIEILDAACVAQIEACLSRQPPWSDVALLLLTGRSASLPAQAFLSRLGNVTILE